MRETTRAGHLIQELAEAAAMEVICGRSRKTPGAFIERLPQKQREVLKTLTSDDVSDAFLWWI